MLLLRIVINSSDGMLLVWKAIVTQDNGQETETGLQKIKHRSARYYRYYRNRINDSHFYAWFQINLNNLYHLRMAKCERNNIICGTMLAKLNFNSWMIWSFWPISNLIEYFNCHILWFSKRKPYIFFNIGRISPGTLYCNEILTSFNWFLSICRGFKFMFNLRWLWQTLKSFRKFYRIPK